MPATTKETDLYEPVRDWLTGQGYTVQAEVRKCDIAAMREEELLVVEMKLKLNWEVLAQAARRQEFADVVYVAIQKPKNIRQWKHRSGGLLYLVRRLELGLLLVSPTARKRPKVRVEIPHELFDRTKQGALRFAVRREVNRRPGDLNTGGSVGRPVISSYRADSVHIACCLERFGPLKIHAIQELTIGLRARQVLTKNAEIDEWFGELPGRIYCLKKAGREGLEEYAEVAEHFREELAGTELSS